MPNTAVEVRRGVTLVAEGGDEGRGGSPELFSGSARS
jgi:hypothetical protein